jgi:hypothetical protein
MGVPGQIQCRLQLIQGYAQFCRHPGVSLPGPVPDRKVGSQAAHGGTGEKGIGIQGNEESAFFVHYQL